LLLSYIEQLHVPNTLRKLNKYKKIQ
jgi:hypothetical protein